MSFYVYMRNKTQNLSILKGELAYFFDVQEVEIIELPQNELVIAIKVIKKIDEVFITIESSDVSEAYSKDTILETKAKNYLTSLKREFKIDQIINSRNK